MNPRSLGAPGVLDRCLVGLSAAAGKQKGETAHPYLVSVERSLHTPECPSDLVADWLPTASTVPCGVKTIVHIETIIEYTNHTQKMCKIENLNWYETSFILVPDGGWEVNISKMLYIKDKSCVCDFSVKLANAIT